MNTIKPEVSVVMPVYNRQEYVSDAISSILNQSFADFEFIIVDDGSTDNSYNLISTFKDSRIKPIKLKENKGNYFARNLGMKRAVGKYICIIDSDDISLPDRIQIQHDFMETHIYKNPGYIFFDEATNALDTKNERVIMDNLGRFFKGRTVVVVAHRLSTVRKADQIVVLEKGKIVEKGTHSELVALGGAYFNLVKDQLELEAMA